MLKHLSRSIAWYKRTIQICDSVPTLGAAPSRDELRDQALQSLTNAFDYARAEAAILAPAEKAQAATSASQKGLQNAYNSAGQRIAGIQAKIAAITQQIPKTPAKKRADLTSQRDVLKTELQINQNLQSTLKRLLDFVNGNGEGDSAGGVAGKIDDLEQTVPEVRANASAAATPAAAANKPATPQSFHPDTAGIMSLGIEIFTLMRGRVQLDHQIEATNALLGEIDQFRNPVRQHLRELLSQTERVSSTPEAGDTAAQQQMRQQLTSLQQQFGQTSNLLVPLRKQGFLLEGARTSLGEWSAELQREYLSSLRYLLLRFFQIGLVIGLIFVLSEVWRRLTFRYVREPRLRRQMLLMRRVGVGFTIALTVILSFVTEFGSVATFAGFITAGIAVALQNVILSVVAYFFLIGRYGVRIGDRVTVSGVTGEVVEVGLVRLYMMELAGVGTNLLPTGRIVVFSNSVFFQPSAFFKQLPGTEYEWHTVTVTLAPDADLEASEKRLMDSLLKVYGTYKDAIKRQHATFEHSVNLQVPEPVPQRFVKYTDQGLEFSIRYPVEIRNANGTDEEVMRSLLDTVNREPKINFAGPPRIQTA